MYDRPPKGKFYLLLFLMVIVLTGVILWTTSIGAADVGFSELLEIILGENGGFSGGDSKTSQYDAGDTPKSGGGAGSQWSEPEKAAQSIDSPPQELAERPTPPNQTKPRIPGLSGNAARIIILQVRLPRVLLAGLVGLALAVSGGVLQAVFRNALAEPYILGISSGAGLGATIGIILGPVLGIVPLVAGFSLIGVAAFLGALLFSLLVYILASVVAPNRGQTILLAGVGLGFLASAGISVLMFLNSQHLEQIVFWTMGSFSSANWQRVYVTAPVVIICTTGIFLLGREVNVLSWGSGTGFILGMRVDAIRRILLVLTSLLTAVSVAAAGIIGFVGLVIPHIFRSWVGVDHRKLLPLSALGGGIFLMVADTLARTIASPREIPVGVVTAILGGPVFLWRVLRPQGSKQGNSYEW